MNAILSANKIMLAAYRGATPTLANAQNSEVIKANPLNIPASSKPAKNVDTISITADIATHAALPVSGKIAPHTPGVNEAGYITSPPNRFGEPKGQPLSDTVTLTIPENPSPLKSPIVYPKANPLPKEDLNLKSLDLKDDEAINPRVPPHLRPIDTLRRPLYATDLQAVDISEDAHSTPFVPPANILLVGTRESLNAPPAMLNNPVNIIA